VTYLAKLNSVASNGKMINESLMGRDLEGRSLSVIEIPSRSLPGGAEEKQDSRCPDRDLNLAPPGERPIPDEAATLLT
jgi:hypothetical protein